MSSKKHNQRLQKIRNPNKTVPEHPRALPSISQENPSPRSAAQHAHVNATELTGLVDPWVSVLSVWMSDMDTGVVHMWQISDADGEKW